MQPNFIVFSSYNPYVQNLERSESFILAGWPRRPQAQANGRHDQDHRQDAAAGKIAPATALFADTASTKASEPSMRTRSAAGKE
jgi:hypothetical protein